MSEAMVPPDNTYHAIQISGNTRVLLGSSDSQAAGRESPLLSLSVLILIHIP